eukprot:scaffold225066_cov30-Tisochrysis_lutea.AAC.2
MGCAASPRRVTRVAVSARRRPDKCKSCCNILAAETDVLLSAELLDDRPPVLPSALASFEHKMSWRIAWSGARSYAGYPVTSSGRVSLRICSMGSCQPAHLRSMRVGHRQGDRVHQ